MTIFYAIAVACLLLFYPDALRAQKVTVSLTSVDIINQTLQENVEFVHVYFVALSGNFHDIIIPVDQLASALSHGLKFSDVHLALDFNSFFIHPPIKNQQKMARIFAAIYENEGIPYIADPRCLLNFAMQKAAQLGYELQIGVDLEFFLLEKNSTGQLISLHAHDAFDVKAQQTHEGIRLDMIQILAHHGIMIEKLQFIDRQGHYRLSFVCDTPMNIADQIILAKHHLEKVAQRHGCSTTFMPQPFVDFHGSQMSIFLTVFDAMHHANLFFDVQGDGFLSPLAHNFLAGILNRMHDATVILKSTVNSFKIFVSGYQVPNYICWAKKNCNALMRIPQINLSKPCTARVEMRSADALCNPYLALTFLLQAGLAGVINHEPCPPAAKEDLSISTAQELRHHAFTALPSSFNQALINFKYSPKMLELFNPVFIQEFIKIKLAEALQFHHAVTDWELQRYL